MADCLIAELDERVEPQMDLYSKIAGKTLTHHTIATGSNSYEIHYRESWFWFGGDPAYYVGLSEVNDLLVVERFSGMWVNLPWTTDSIEACEERMG